MGMIQRGFCLGRSDGDGCLFLVFLGFISLFLDRFAFSFFCLLSAARNLATFGGPV